MRDRPKTPRRRGQVIDLGAGRFKLRVPTGRDPQGKRTYHNETLYDTTRAEAEKRVTALLARLDSGTYFRPSPLTLEDFLEREWLPQKVRDGARPTSAHQYEKCVRNYLLPRLGAVRLCDLKPKAVQDLYNSWQDANLSAATMNLARTVLSMALKQAVLWGYLQASPAAGIRLPASTAEGRGGRSFTSAEELEFIVVATGRVE